MFWFVKSDNELISSLKAIFFVSRLFGTFPLNKKLQLSIPNVAYSICLAFFCLASMYFDKDESLRRRGWRDIVFIAYLSISTAICDSVEFITSILFCWNRSKIQSVFKEFMSILETLKTVGEPVEFHGVLHVRLLLLWMGYFLLAFAYEINTRVETEENYFVDLIDYSIVGKFLMLISPCTVLTLYIALFTVTRLIFKHLRTRTRRMFQGKPMKDNYLKVKTFLTAFNRLCDLCVTTCSVFGLILFVTILNTFYSATIMTYYMITKLNNFEKHTPLHWFVLWITHFSAKVWLIIESVTLATKEAKQFTQTVYEIMISENNHLSKEEEELFKMHLSRKREISLMVCGLFPLDRTLAHSIFATATTYLVILIQFGDKDDGENKDQMSTSEYSNATTMISTTFD